MKRFAILFLLSVLLVNLVTPASNSASDAPRFVSLEGGFSISLPERYKQLTPLTIRIPSANAHGKLYEWQIKDRVFSIGYADRFLPISDSEAVQLFDGVAENFRSLALSVNGNLGSVKNITLDKHPGIELRADINKASLHTDFSSNGDILWRRVFKYEGNQKEELFYPENRSLTQRTLNVIDDKGNEIERTVFAADGKVRSKVSFTYEFDSNGNWTRQTRSWSVVDERLRPFEPTSVLRTITYY